MPGAQATAPAPGDTMGAQGGIATLLLLLLLPLLACQPQPLHAGPPAGGKPCPASPPEGWSGEKPGGIRLSFGCAGWAGRDGDLGGSGVGTHGCRLSLPEVRGACRQAGRSKERQLPVFGQGVWARVPCGESQGKEWGYSPTTAFRVLGTLAVSDAFPRGTCKRGAGWDGARSPHTCRSCRALVCAVGSPQEKGTFPALPKPCAVGMEHGHVLQPGQGEPALPAHVWPCHSSCLRGQPLSSEEPGLGQCRWEGRSWTAFARVCVTSRLCSVRLSCAPGVAGCMGRGAHLSCRHSPRGVQDHPSGDGAPGTIQG